MIFRLNSFGDSKLWLEDMNLSNLWRVRLYRGRMGWRQFNCSCPFLVPRTRATVVMWSRSFVRSRHWENGI